MPTANHSHPPPAQVRMTVGQRAGQVNWTLLLWAIGVPLPLVAIVALVRGCS